MKKIKFKSMLFSSALIHVVTILMLFICACNKEESPKSPFQVSEDELRLEISRSFEGDEQVLKIEYPHPTIIVATFTVNGSVVLTHNIDTQPPPCTLSEIVFASGDSYLVNLMNDAECYAYVFPDYVNLNGSEIDIEYEEWEEILMDTDFSEGIFEEKVQGLAWNIDREQELETYLDFVLEVQNEINNGTIDLPCWEDFCGICMTTVVGFVTNFFKLAICTTTMGCVPSDLETIVLPTGPGLKCVSCLRCETECYIIITSGQKAYAQFVNELNVNVFVHLLMTNNTFAVGDTMEPEDCTLMDLGEDVWEFEISRCSNSGSNSGIAECDNPNDTKTIFLDLKRGHTEKIIIDENFF